jgi:tRNA 2-thiouridine synthesizing protein A
LKEIVTDPEILVDARGHRCPVPTLRLMRACASAAPGSIVRLLTDDPLARIDAPHFASQVGHEILDIVADGTEISVRLRTRDTTPENEGCGAPLGGNGAPPG